MNKLILLFILSSPFLYSQVGINTENPTETLDISGTLRVRNLDSYNYSSEDVLDSIAVFNNDGVIGYAKFEDLLNEANPSSFANTEKFTTGTTTPSISTSDQTGDTYYNSLDNTWWYFNNSEWLNITPNLETTLKVGNDAGDNQIINLATPTDSKDATTKNYVDDTAVTTGNYIPADRKIQLIDNLNNTHIELVLDNMPLTVNGSAPDGNGNIAVALSDVSTGPLDSNGDIPPGIESNYTGGVLTDGDIYIVSGDSNPGNDGRSFVYENDTTMWIEIKTNLNASDLRYVNTSGDTMMGDLNFTYNGTSFNITNLADPNNPQDASTKNYVDNLDITDKQTIGNTIATVTESDNTIHTIKETITNLSFDPNNNQLTYLDEEGTSNNIDLSNYVSSDNQTISLDTNILTLEDGGTVDLTPYLDNTDDQNITDFSLTNNTLSITLEDGGTQNVDLSNYVSSDNQTISLDTNILTLEDGGTVDLTPYLDNTDDQNITDFSLTNNTLSITLEDGGTQNVDLSNYVSSDNQTISLDTNILTLEDGGTVDLTPYLDNTDDQNITDFSLTNNTLSITLEDGGTQNVDLSNYVSSDNQTISLDTNILTLEDGGTVDLTPYLDNTDDQNITDFSLTNNTLSITLEDGGTQNVDLSNYVSSDNQTISLDTNILTLEDGGTVDLTPYLDNTDDQNITDFSLTNNTLSITLEDGGTQNVDLSNYVSSDNQTISLDTNILTLEDGGTVDLTPYLDNTDDQNITDFSLTNNTLSITLEDGGTQNVDLSNYVSSDNQTISLDTNILTLEDGGTVDLTPYLDNTDDQNITDFSLTNNTLSITLEDGGTQNVDLSNYVSSDNQTISLDTNILTLEDGGTVDLTPYLDNTDDQNITDFSLTNNTLSITLEDGGTQNVDLSNYVSSDNQTISLDTNILTLEDGGTVDLTPYLDNTDDQNITDFSLTNNTLSITLEDGGTQNVDLSNYVSSDNQTISLDTNILTLEDGGTVDLTPYLDNTDDQNITDFSLTNNTLSITLEDGGTQNVDLSNYVSSDNQTISLDTNILTLEDGGTVDLTPYLDNTDDQNITDFSLTNNTLSITLEDGGTQNVDLSNYVSSDNQTISLDTNILTLEDGGTVDLTPYLDNTDNQNITDFSLTNNTLSITLEDGGTQNVDLSNYVSSDNQTISLDTNILTLEDGGTVDLTPYLDNTDDQNITDFSLTNNTLSITLEDGGTQNVDLSTLNTPETTTNLSQNTTTGTISFTNEENVTQTASLISSDTDNSITTGSDGGTYYKQPTLIVDKETIGYVFAAAHTDKNGTNSFNINSTVTRTSTGRYTITFTEPHPNGNDYDITLGVEEDVVNRDSRIVKIIEGTEMSTGFQVMVLTGDNGLTADDFVDEDWSFSVSATKEVVTDVRFE